ncbi:hypothetical protein DVA67_005145 [Solirubrobacter sp. CPCC 204708]|uniref:Calcium-binding protein n=1 Tax=Solirubrobacter deserti TaxID=2282478 RepID=A0ABT4RGZ2_9ACTN|nr:calcium-binding protein [Solirubrobacter deserti]MBE2315350.1 hypothetical protein [Solirubrobacter deserti]MDA0137805.1 hypothetical protein [Solirubrobacter deserti]
MSFTSGTLGIVAGLLLWTAPAPAATVTARDRVELDTRLGSLDWRDVDYVAAPGEVNRLELTETAGHGLRLRDPAGITATPPCVQEDPQTASCPPHGGRILRVSLGDGDDRVSQALGLYGVNTNVDAGDGNDIVEFPLAALVLGGPGDDTLAGERVLGGPGADVMTAETLDYSDHAEGVTVDLAGGTAGAAGENDQIAPGTEILYGGSGPDVLRAPLGGGVIIHSHDGADVIEGSDGNESLNGGPGNDVIRARGGRDWLTGDAGDDQLDAGAGPDTTYAGDGNDRLDGGAGRDELHGERGTDVLLARDGERDAVGCGGPFDGDRATIDTADEDTWCPHVSGARRLILHGITRVGVRSAQIVLSCRAARACTGRLRVDGGRVAQRRVRVPAGRRRSVALRLDRAGGAVEVEVVTPRNGVLRARLGEARR